MTLDERLTRIEVAIAALALELPHSNNECSEIIDEYKDYVRKTLKKIDFKTFAGENSKIQSKRLKLIKRKKQWKLKITKEK